MQTSIIPSSPIRNWDSLMKEQLKNLFNNYMCTPYKSLLSKPMLNVSCTGNLKYQWKLMQERDQYTFKERGKAGAPSFDFATFAVDEVSGAICSNWSATFWGENFPSRRLFELDIFAFQITRNNKIDFFLEIEVIFRK